MLLSPESLTGRLSVCGGVAFVPPGRRFVMQNTSQKRGGIRSVTWPSCVRTTGVLPQKVWSLGFGSSLILRFQFPHLEPLGLAFRCPASSQEVPGVLLGKTERTNPQASNSLLPELSLVCFPREARDIRGGGEHVLTRCSLAESLGCEAVSRQRANEVCS